MTEGWSTCFLRCVSRHAAAAMTLAHLLRGHMWLPLLRLLRRLCTSAIGHCGMEVTNNHSSCSLASQTADFCGYSKPSEACRSQTLSQQRAEAKMQLQPGRELKPKLWVDALAEASMARHSRPLVSWMRPPCACWSALPVSQQGSSQRWPLTQRPSLCCLCVEPSTRTSRTGVSMRAMRGANVQLWKRWHLPWRQWRTVERRQLGS